MVALTGIEPDGCRFSSVQLGLSSCVFSPVGIPARSRIFLLGAAGEQEENGLGASASGPARTLTQNVPLGSRVVSQKVNFLGQGNKGGLISSAVRRRTGEYPPARLLLPGGLEPRSLCCSVEVPTGGLREAGCRRTRRRRVSRGSRGSAALGR